MQQTLRAEWSGMVKAVHVGVGQMVLGGAPILELE
jgi:biotin carboxyl carrier protein